MPRLKLFIYREGEDFAYPAEARERFGEPLPAPLFPPGGPDGDWDEVRDPDAADFFLFPYKLDPLICLRRTPFTRALLAELPHFDRHEARHVFFHFHDLGQPLCTSAVIVTDSPRRTNRDDPHVECFPYFPFPHVLAAAPAFDFGRIRFDVSFVGTVSDPVRLTLLESIGAEKRLRHYLSAPTAPDWDRRDSYLHLENERRKRALERLYLGVLERSWASLCPRGRGSSSIRFFETLCLGRLAVHVSGEYVPPLADVIDYGRFCLFLTEDDAPRAGEIVHEWLRDKDADERRALCLAARRAWEEHLAPQHARGLALDILRRHKARLDALVEVPPRLTDGPLSGQGPRRVREPGFYRNMALDDGRNWFCGGMAILAGPEPGGFSVNGAPGDFGPRRLNRLFAAGRAAPPGGTVAVLGGGAGVSALALASGLLSARNLDGRVYCLGMRREELLPHAVRAGVEFLLRPLDAPVSGAAGLFRPGCVDLLFLNRDRCAEALAELPAWRERLAPGGVILGHAGRGEGAEEALEAAATLAAQAGARLTALPEQGLFRILTGEAAG